MSPNSAEPARRPALSKRDVVALLLFFGGLASLRALRRVSEALLTLWTFTYEHGFLKRALVGDVVARAFGPPSPMLVTIVSGGIALALAAALLRWFAGPALREESPGAWLFAFVAATHSATLPNLFYELGRFDHIGFLLLLGCLTVIGRGTPALRLGVVPAACAVGLIVHEAFALMFVPLILAVWDYEEGGRGRVVRGIVLAGLAALTLAIGTYGLMTALPMEEYVRVLQSRHAFEIQQGSVFVLYSDLAQNVRGTLNTIRDRWYLANHVGMFVVLLPSFLFLGRLVRAVSAREGASGTPVNLVFLAALTPLLLYPLGWDFSRWWAIALTNLFIAVSYLSIREGSTRVMADAVERMPLIVAAVLGVSLIAGPLGVVQPFPRFDGLWLVVYAAFYGLVP